ncbi:hypothetical protein DPMN_155670 [Dreissena polymorpha]|uniref:Uncharacterized protein n=1 Tax=Dreissena polymorpha TaxID=45954 RepID=A0A9D4FQT0_DREPO|nr:hypothetical protein DPMN_155670 [Dreissena polymorpha]
MLEQQLFTYARSSAPARSWPVICVTRKYHTWSCVRNWRDNILLRSKLKAANNWTVVPINEKKGYTYMH